jgi:hypothetical protein
VSNTLILNLPWPDDLDIETVPFATRTTTVLKRRGFYDDPTRFDDLTVADLAGWWNTGPATVANLRTTAHTAIRQHHRETELRVRLTVDLDSVASEAWSAQVWYRDPRFTAFVPNRKVTVHDIATCGTASDRRYLWDRLPGLYAAIESQTALGVREAVAQYVEAISGQHGERLEVLLARTGLNGRDPITGAEAGRRLGVSYQRIHQLEQQLEAHRTRCAAPAGIWMPQVGETERDIWPDGFTEGGVATIRSFFRKESDT